MQTVTTAEAAAKLSTLIEQARTSPILIRNDGEDVAVLVSVRPKEKTDAERQANWKRFVASRDGVAAELQAKLTQEGTTVEEFLADALKD